MSDKYTCPKPASGPRTVKSKLGKVLSFAPNDDACVWCDHCDEHIDKHGKKRAVAKRDTQGGEGR